MWSEEGVPPPRRPASTHPLDPRSPSPEESLSVSAAPFSPDPWLLPHPPASTPRKRLVPQLDDVASLASDEELGPLDLDSPDDDDSILEQLEGSPSIPELTAEEEAEEERSWRSCLVAGAQRKIDMKVIEPYKRVLSHGGYLTSGSHNAIIVFSACFLPHRSRVDYNYVMDNLFCYVIMTLEQLVTDDYVLVYLHGATSKDCIPTFSWLKRCYQMIDRRLRKNLKMLYLVHPTFWLKTVIVMTKPFVSSKFSRKMQFVNSLSELFDTLPLEQACIPERVCQYDRIKQSIEQRRH